jgi:hypothetical protein
MAALKNPARPCWRPPTEAESRLAKESSRLLGPTLADLVVPKNGGSPARTVRLRTCAKITCQIPDCLGKIV